MLAELSERLVQIQILWFRMCFRLNDGDRNLRQPSYKSKKLLNEYQRLINGVQSLFNEAQRLINGVQNLFNEYQRLINGVQSLFNEAQRLINGVQRLVDKST